MAQMSKKLQEIHAEALAEFDEIQSAVHDERLQCLKDRRFYSIAGAQWEGKLSDQYENKPKFEVNKCHLSVIRIFNEYRNNRITVDFVSQDGSANDKLADVCDGLYRATEQDSAADEAYDNAFEEAVGGGIGAWRLRAEYEDEDDDENEYQKICIEPIYDADSCVFFDLGAKRQDKADAKRCFVLSSMTISAYKHEFDDDPASWPKEITQTEFDWMEPDVLYIAEYYRVEKVPRTIKIYETLDGSEERYSDEDFENDPELEDTLIATGATLIREKKVKQQRVHKYLMSGGKILEDCGIIAGKYIPIVPVYGKRWFVDNVERCMGHIRLARDSQRLKNMQLSKLAEISTYSNVEKPVFTPEQMAGHEVMWAEDNIKNYPFLLINPMTDGMGNQLPSGPIGYTKPPIIPPAMAALLQVTETDMQELLGSQQNAEEMMPNVSGKAVELIQNRLDMQAFIYMSNMAKAIKRSGEIWLSMAKDVLIEPGRKMKAIWKNGDVGSVDLAKPILRDGVTEYENDMSQAKFDLSVEVGPSSDSKRASTVRALTGMMTITQDPETLQVLSAMAMMNMEGEGISDVRDFFRRKLLKMGAVKPTEEEAQELAQEAQNQRPTAQDEYLMASAEAEKSRAAEAKADTILNLAKAEETQAKTAETLAGIDRKDREQALEVAKAMQEALEPQQPVTAPKSEGQ